MDGLSLFETLPFIATSTVPEFVSSKITSVIVGTTGTVITKISVGQLVVCPGAQTAIVYV